MLGQPGPRRQSVRSRPSLAPVPAEFRLTAPPAVASVSVAVLFSRLLGVLPLARPSLSPELRSRAAAPVSNFVSGLLRGPHVICGYWKQPELSKFMLRDVPFLYERVLRTQDWFKLDDESYLYFRGRRDDNINTRGKKSGSSGSRKHSLWKFPGFVRPP